MKVYRIRVGAGDTYKQLVLLEGYDGMALQFLGRPVANWIRPKVYVYNPLLETPDFWSIAGCNTFAFDAGLDVFRQLPLGALLEDAGEWLEVDVEDGRPLTLVNVTTVVNAIDISKTRWTSTDAGQHKFIEYASGAYAFHPERLPETSIFKIPQNNAAELLCWERDGDPRYEFKAAVEAENLKGLRFNLLWEG